MKIYHLYHSGFLIQFDDKTLIFDCFTHIPTSLLRQNIPHYFFVSHGHGDHYTADIFATERVYHPTYILSDDIPKASSHQTHAIGPYQHMSLGGMDIKTFGSTDQGLSYYIVTNQHCIFHAGDLNWWDWDTKLKPQIDPEQEERDFKAELEKMKNLPMEIAFVPVDPRLGDSYYKAGQYFIETFHPKVLIPMHFRDDFGIIKKFKNKIGNTKTVVPEFGQRNEKIRNTWTRKG